MAETGNKQAPDFRLHRENGSSDYLFVHFRSPAMLWAGDEYVPVDKGVCVLFDRGKKQSYYGCGQTEFFHDYIHFESTDELEELLFFDLPKGEPLYLTMPQRITEALAELEKEYNDFSHYRNELLGSLGRVFFYRIKEQIECANVHTKQREAFRALYELRTQIYREPGRDWSIEQMCRQVCMSRSYLQHLYREFFQVACTEDVIRARLAAAKAMLAAGDLKINVIAGRCGYRSVSHFLRQFKRHAGMSPGEFRSRSGTADTENK